MYVINFKLFNNQLHSDTTGDENTPTDSPVLISFSLKGDYTKQSLLKEFVKHLNHNSINWIRPYNNLMKEWIIDMSELRESYNFLRKVSYLKDETIVEPKYRNNANDNLLNPENSIESRISFRINKEEIYSYTNIYHRSIPSELTIPLEKFRQDHTHSKCAFLMMKYEDTPLQSKLVKLLRNIFHEYGFDLLRADDKEYSDDLLINIKTYMNGCEIGVVIFDRVNTNYFNPNVSLEVGYMMALKKPILFLKEKTLDSLQSDLVGKLYKIFDIQVPEKTLKESVHKWLKDNDLA